jgi:hypothetical protein
MTLGVIPYTFTIKNEKFPARCLGNITFTNLGKTSVSQNSKQQITAEMMFRSGWSVENSGFIALPIPGNSNLVLGLELWYK